MMKLEEASPRFFPAREPDDDAGHLHRQVIGYLGALLPLMILGLASFRPTRGLPLRLDSVSAYYYTGAVAVFTGVLASLAVFFFTYPGYKEGWDRFFARVAGTCAVLVAAFPTAAPRCALQLSWWTKTTGIVHFAAAAVLFVDFAAISLFLFTRSKAKASDRPLEKKVRNGIYRFCGAAMLACIAWAGISHFVFKGPIFWPEVLALEFFAFSWLTKGRAEWTLARLAGRKSRAE